MFIVDALLGWRLSEPKWLVRLRIYCSVGLTLAVVYYTFILLPNFFSTEFSLDIIVADYRFALFPDTVIPQPLELSNIVLNYYDSLYDSLDDPYLVTKANFTWSEYYRTLSFGPIDSVNYTRPALQLDFTGLQPNGSITLNYSPYLVTLAFNEEVKVCTRTDHYYNIINQNFTAPAIFVLSRKPSNVTRLILERCIDYSTAYSTAIPDLEYHERSRYTIGGTLSTLGGFLSSLTALFTIAFGVQRLSPWGAAQGYFLRGRHTRYDIKAELRKEFNRVEGIPFVDPVPNTNSPHSDSYLLAKRLELLESLLADYYLDTNMMKAIGRNRTEPPRDVHDMRGSDGSPSTIRFMLQPFRDEKQEVNEGTDA